MLKGIPSIISPELLKILMEMGHGDEIVLGDGNFGAANLAQRLVRCDGHGVPELLEAILQLFPLDTYVESPVVLMETGSDGPEPAIWSKFRQIIEQENKVLPNIHYLDRFEFYERTRQAYAVVATSEMALYACVILKKGVLTA